MNHLNRDPRSVTTRQSRELAGPQLVTLGFLLWDHVTLDSDLTLQLFIKLLEKLGDFHNHGYAVGNLHPEGVVLLMEGDKVKSAHIKKPGKTTLNAHTEEINLSFGKTHYVSPEGLKGSPPTLRSDIYSVGTMMQTALTGVPVKEDMTVIDTLKFKTTNRMPLTSQEQRVVSLKEVASYCLVEDEKLRYLSASELKAELARIQRGERPLGPSALTTRRPIPVSKVLQPLFLAVWLVITLASFNAGIGQPAPVLEGLWNKPPDQYEMGDHFSITLRSKKNCFAYLFYIDESDETLSLYPARSQHNNVIGANKTLPVEGVADHNMQVDGTKGKLVLVSIDVDGKGSEIKRRFLQDNDWAIGRAPKNHCLTISGTDLLARLEQLRKENPNSVYYSVDDAPRAFEKDDPKAPKISRFAVSIRLNDTTYSIGNGFGF
ncbi:MAG: DUF4384 domain-containing protein [Candidatus Obscuribacterales bacterium]|nr:DUF4384 domain-containing protein [Candidatus Obscuribacterales bacterium]